jgi:PAS domain S-box-containing protein
MADASSFTRQLAVLGGSTDDILERVRVPAYLVGADGRIRWLNAAARDLVGNASGRQFLDVVVPQDRERASRAFADKILGRAESTDMRFELQLRGGGSTPCEISSMPIRTGAERIVGVFGIATPPRTKRAKSRGQAELTPRQRETLMLLGEGASTEMIAERLGVARETARNHIRAVLRELGARSRLEAVVEAHARGLL